MFKRELRHFEAKAQINSIHAFENKPIETNEHAHYLY